jgi:hypothetical protein
VVDLAQVVNARYDANASDRLSAEDLAQIRSQLAEKGLVLHTSDGASQKLFELRSLYEPYAQAIARNLFISLPPWIHHDPIKDNWRSGPWDRVIQARGLGRIASGRADHTINIDEHF